MMIRTGGRNLLVAAIAVAATGLLSATAGQAASLPKNQNGFYLMQGKSDDQSRYFAVDALCVAEKHNVFIAFKEDGAGLVDFLSLNRAGNLNRETLRLGEADAGDSQIYYSLSEPETGEGVGRLHYINPGALGDPAKIAMNTLSSITIDDARGECMVQPDVVYVGVTNQRRLMVTANAQGKLVLSEFSRVGGELLSTKTGGYWSTGKADEIVFSFIEGDELTSLKASPHERIAYPAWRKTRAGTREFSASPQSFFVADMEKFGSRENRMPYGLALHFERLEICRHLAGEASGDPGRDAQLAKSIERSGCSAAKANHSEYVKQSGNDEKLSKMLTLLKPDF
ncbi:hypothetical protein [Parasphingorhabdus sp.]|uniref:hypothetical protein n=1 Tax=Parasphingorhabdus sp. TaxID=2709688 RepID=UPI00329A52A6